MKTAHVPHPFDSHPSMSERMRNVGYTLDEGNYSAVVARAPTASWAPEILTAASIEGRLWAAYEKQFSEDHEESLAYRYEPATEAEQALVLKYFPTLEFALSGGLVLHISYLGITPPDGKPLIGWDSVRALTYASHTLGDKLHIAPPKRNAFGLFTRTNIKLRGIKNQKGALQAALNRYWGRHKVMRAQQKASIGTR